VKIGTSGYISAQIGTYVEEKKLTVYDTLFHLSKNLVTNAGLDWMHAQLYTNTGTGTTAARFIAVSETTSPPDETWTTLSGEIDTGGLTRAAASPNPSHVAGTNVSIIEKTFTASANFPNVQVVALFNASSSGVLVHVGRFPQIANVANGQNFRVLCTINHGG
jgi:hypothetical protein